MARIAFILLCHKDPEAVILQAEGLTANGDCVAIHFDARAGRSGYARLREGLAGNPNVTFARRRNRCGWGEWSLVQATLDAARAALAAFPRATHLYLVSGDCMPIKPAAHAHAVLDAADADHVECFDFFTSDWIRTGIREERLVYRHLFNERTRRRLFYASLAAQQRLGLRRAVPQGLRMMIGSQWWCLRRQTVERVLEFIAARRDILRFFRTTWIPDETFFQTLVRHLVPAAEIRPRTLTFLMFSDYGMPVSFYNDQYDLLVGQDYLFARKISPDAAALKARLGALYADDTAEVRISGEGRGLYAFLTGRGRSGQRFAPRLWDTGATLGAGRTLMVVVCKKWHVAKRLVDRAGADAGATGLAYLFTEEATPLPALGGIGSSLAKRSRHPRAFLRLLYDHFRTERLMICLDPAQLDLMRDLAADRAEVRFLDVGCAFSDDYLRGHAHRVGLAGAATPEATMARILPALRNDIRHEAERMRDAGLSRLYRIGEAAGPSANAAALAAFLGIAQDRAEAIAAADHLFSD